MPDLTVDDVHAGYGQTLVLRGVSIKVEAGEIVTLIGPNGAGKTTLLNVISGFIPPRAGRLGFSGTNLARMSPQAIVRSGISQVPEGRRIFPELTVMENLTLGAYTVSDGGAVRRLQAEAFELFPILKSRSTQAGGTLSGGEQQMLAIARALMAKPKLLMLDEPSMGLAPLVVRQIYTTFSEIVAQGTSILLVEQNARRALKVAHRGYVLERGEIVLTDSATALAESDELKAVYLGGHLR